jgi:hypothetical protein
VGRLRLQGLELAQAAMEPSQKYPEFDLHVEGIDKVAVEYDWQFGVLMCA